MVQEELFEVIDEAGKVVGKEKRSLVHRKGLLHKSVHVFVLDERGQNFIQLRSEKRDIGPGLWDLSAAEHLKPGESFEEAAARGVKEELGVEPVEMEKLGEKLQYFDYGELKDNERVASFKCGFKGQVKLQKEEVTEGKWVSKEELLQEMVSDSKKFTPWLLQDKSVELL